MVVTRRKYSIGTRENRPRINIKQSKINFQLFCEIKIINYTTIKFIDRTYFTFFDQRNRIRSLIKEKNKYQSK